MDIRLARQIFGTAFLAVAVSLGVSAQPGARQRPAATDAPAIRLRAAAFTPARGERPPVPAALTIRDYPPGRRGYYIVQFDAPIDDAWKSALIAGGAEVLEYIPDFALKVRSTPAEAGQIAALPHVAWVGVFHPAYKLPPDVPRGTQARAYVVRIERGANVAVAAAAIAAAGVTIVQRDDRMLTVAATESGIEAVAHVIDVASIEAFVLPQKHNEFGGGIIGSDIAAAAGYDGSTQTIAVTDSGIGGGTAATVHAHIPPERVAGIHNWPGVRSFCFETVFNDGPIDVDTGHGTHVATSALGGGDASGMGRGSAPASRLLFQAIEDYALPSYFCQLLLGLPPGYYLTGIPANLGMLFQQSYDAGARVHSNSWGSAVNGAYTEDSVEADTFVWAHRDLAITISAGNAGVDANRDGIVDGGSINSPATAKNVITVGASEGDRGTSYACDTNAGATCAANGGNNEVFTYGAAFGAAFSVNPLKDDLSAGNAGQMAAFSSRGPTADGRIKPDVVAPGTWMLSGYSDLFQQYYDSSANPQNGAYQYDGWGEPLNDQYKYMGGTSMSAPLVAGAAAVVRDYYEKAHAHAASAALVKATLVNAAIDLLDENNDGVDDNAYPVPNIHEGWGRVDLAAATDSSRDYIDEGIALHTGTSASYSVSVDESLRPLKITLAWTDAPSTTAAAIALVNDLDLEVVAPDGSVYSGNSFFDGWSIAGTTPDRVNNLENVYVVAPVAGEWIVRVRGYNVPQGPQPFALVMGRDAAPVPQIARVSVTATDATATEAGQTGAAFTLMRSGDLASELTVAYELSGTALHGDDYASPSATAVFAAGSATAEVSVAPIDDGLVEPDETVVLTVIAGETYGVRAPASATISIVSDDQPGDLTVSVVSAPPRAASGATIVISETTRNQGSWPVQSSETGLYLSANGALDASDVLLAAREVPNLAAGSMHTHATSITLPRGVAGSYYVIAKADWNAAVPETSEWNNARSSSPVRIGPDLVVASLSISSYGSPGGSLTITDSVRNDGAEPAGASVTAYYLSANVAWDAADIQLGTRTVPVLPAGATQQGSVTVAIPADVGVGNYYVIAHADNQATIAEAVETNNTRSAGTLKIGADLVVTAGSPAPVAAPGGPLTVTDTTRNQGAAAAGEFVTAYYLSANPSLDAADVRLGARTISALDANAQNAGVAQVTIPASVVPGVYYVIAYADDGNAITEPVETNNARTGSPGVKIGPDLQVSSVKAPLIGGAGMTLTVTNTITNAGGAASSPAETVFYLSSNTSIDATDVELGRQAIAALNPGAVDTRAMVLTMPPTTAVGTYYIVEHVDLDDAVDEAIEYNNVRSSGGIRIGPDLALTALSASSSVSAGASFSVSETTRNVGGGDASASTTTFFLSVDTTVDAGDAVLGQRAVPSLAPGAGDTLTSALQIPASTPAGTYYLIAAANDGSTVQETLTSNNTRRVTVRVAQP